MEISAILVRTGEKPQLVNISNSLESLQKIVGGFIEIIALTDDEDVDIVINEEGKLNGLPLNRFITHKGQIIDTLMGDIVIVGADPKTGKTIDIPPSKIARFIDMFSKDCIEI